MKNQKFIFVLTIAFLIWIAFLIAVMVLIPPDVVFYDFLNKENVSGEYTFRIPAIRYLFEPFIGMILFFTIKNYYYPLAILLIYIIVRIIYVINKKKQIIHSEKINLLIYSVRDFLAYTVKTGFIVVGSILLYLLMAFLVRGPFYKYGIIFFAELVIIGYYLLLTAKLAETLYKYAHPHLRFEYSEKAHLNVDPNLEGGIKILRITKRELTYFLGFVCLFLSANVLTMTMLVPTREIETDLEDDEILIDLHCHTILSDGWLSPQERVMWYIQQGINVAAFSDHHTTYGAIHAQEFVDRYDLDFTVIIAQEYTTSLGIHMNIYGMKEILVPESYNTENGPKALSVEDVIKYVKNKGGYITVNHYNAKDNGDGTYGDPYTLEELKEWGVDGFEIINHGNLYPEEIREFCVENDLICIAATDIHNNWEINSFMRLELQDPDDLSVDNIFANLRNNTHQAVQIRSPREVVSFEEFFENFEEVELIVNYLLTLDLFQTISWIAWSAAGFAILGKLYLKIKDADIRKMREKLL